LQPMPSPGLAVTAEPVPLNVTLVVIAERRSLARLKAIDPRADSYFSHAVRFDATQSALRSGAAL
jgi:predicted ATP-dependent protease